MTTGIVVALPEELSTLTSGKVKQGQYIDLNKKVLIAYAGAGPQNARKAAQGLVAKGARQLISWGCAAALDAELKPGDLVLPEKLLSEKNQPFMCDAAWTMHVRQLLNAALTINCGDLTESSRIVSSSSDKVALFSQRQAVALDMESCAIAEIAKQSDIPCLVIRVIADPVGMDLPDAVSHAMNAKGGIALAKLIQYTVIHPMQIPGLMKLGLHFNAAKKTLQAIAKYLDQIVDFDPNLPGH